MIPGRYASGRTLDEALDGCRGCSSSQFDSAVVDGLLRLAAVDSLARGLTPPTGPARWPVG